jgi:hypothetical protein
MSESIRHWSENPLWTSALERYYERRDSGADTLQIDIAALEGLIFSAESPAYEFMEAMCSVQALEGWDGHRGASRLIFALLQLLHERAVRG